MSLVENVFRPACNGGTCHGDGVPAWDLHLVGMDVERQVVGEHSGSCPGWQLVVPGSPEKSFLWQKISSPHPPCGQRMPWGGKPLSPGTLECVRAWITGLAPDAAPRPEGATDGGVF